MINPNSLRPNPRLTTQENPTAYRIFKSQKLLESIDEITENLTNLTVENINHPTRNSHNIKMSFDEGNRVDNCVENLFKSLRIPDAIKDLPHYEGSRHTLYEFIENVEEILTLCNNVDGQPCSKIYLRAIRNKIKGEANEVLTMYGTPLQWEAIKDNLITHYADKRNETNLIRDLYGISQGADKVEKYFARIIDIQSTIINHIKLNETNAIVIRAKGDLYREMCLNTFLAGLREPMGSMIRAMQPSSLTEAFTHCLKEQNMAYLRKGSTQNSYSTVPVPPRTTMPRILHGNQSNPPRNYYTSGPPIPQPKAGPSYNYQPAPQYYNHRPFTKQNPVSSGMSPTHNRFTFKPPMVPPRKAEQMDTTSNHNNYKQFSSVNPTNNYRFQPMGPPRVRAQELYTSEDPQEPYPPIDNQQEEICEEQSQPYFQDLDEVEVDDGNFHQDASPSESAT